LSNHPQYDAVIFDLYGTLIDFMPDAAYRKVNDEMARVLSVPADKLRRAWMGCIEERNAGRLGSLEQTIAHVCGLLGVCPEREQIGRAAALRLDIIRLNLRPRRDAIRTLSIIKDAGLRLGLVSDCCVEVPMVWPETPFADLIDAPAFSCSAQTLKPDPRIYEVARSGLGVQYGRCLYVGDGSSRELTGARSLGMHPVLIRTEYDNFMDPFRADALEWDGPSVASLSDLVPLLGPPVSQS